MYTLKVNVFGCAILIITQCSHFTAGYTTGYTTGCKVYTAPKHVETVHAVC